MSSDTLKRITKGEMCACYAEPWRKTSFIQRFQFYKEWRYSLIFGRLQQRKLLSVNCFKKVGINPDVQQAAIADSDDPFKGFQEKLSDLKSADPSMAPEDFTAESTVSWC